ncbi:uncharacterized protein A1O5_10994 [Cladophialophora psammophila CBS 110553]|uniref:Peptidase S8/S53 domain-containing protein n=1 Tax=Cladophialophora psammophila CBS 110553 TaxID=1182543 RepID=W9WD21_9EURO|nr:uncharacterized protein A1O5_10994 [Cladophialophora psammophila CBS 110553]EXJ66017.1 hypothetical protein A1O5_10994 [Cladophialophora psammophila CBS 110553]
MAPFADIYVAEVGPANERLKDKPLTEALNFAIAQEAKIVVMAFGWEKDEKNPQYPAFERSLEKIAKGSLPTLLFAAACNGGVEQRRTYPAIENSVFAIHASDHEGKFRGYNPPPILGQKNYITIGDEVPGYDENSRESGTSFATVVAAAIAASIIEMMRRYGSQDDQWPLEYLQTYDGMSKVFQKMSKPRGDLYDYLDWPDLFSLHNTDEEICEEITRWLKDNKT